MKTVKKYISVVADTAFFAFAFFVAAFTLLNRAVKRPFSLIAAIFLSLAFSVLIFGFLLSRKNKQNKKSSEKKDRELYLIQLVFMQKSEVSALFLQAFQNCGKVFKKTRDLFTLATEKCVYTFSQGVDGASKAEIVKLFNSLKTGETGKIFCLDCTKDVIAFASRFGGRIVLLGGEKTYRFLKNNNSLPKVKFSPFNENKPKLQMKNFLDRKKAVKFMLYGLGFALMSFIVRYNAYYVVFGCAFLILSAAAMIFGTREKAA
ncbi:MAG: hypothetical protein SPL13_01660 [Clostridia bacterium]|nr:hypothetical protein [Clostridia bacterium]